MKLREYDRGHYVEVCRSKKWYASEEEARAAALVYTQHVYRCSICRLHHLSTNRRPGLEEVLWRVEGHYQNQARQRKEVKQARGLVLPEMIAP